MTPLYRCTMLTLALWPGLATPLAADVVLEDVNACFVETHNQGAPVAGCVEAAHATCLTTDEGAHAVATLCFVNAEKIWSGGIADRLAQVSEAATEEIATIASIEVKYDLLSALLQCDRMEELQLVVGRDTEEDILRTNARCKARAAALSYARLFLRSRDLDQP